MSPNFSPRSVQKPDLLQIVQVAEPVTRLPAAILAPCAGPSIRSNSGLMSVAGWVVRGDEVELEQQVGSRAEPCLGDTGEPFGGNGSTASQRSTCEGSWVSTGGLLEPVRGPIGTGPLGHPEPPGRGGRSESRRRDHPDHFRPESNSLRKEDLCSRHRTAELGSSRLSSG